MKIKLPKHPILDVQHDDLMSTRDMMDCMTEISHQLARIKDVRRTMKKVKKAVRESRLTSEQGIKYLDDLRLMLVDAFKQASLHGFAMGQGDETGWSDRAEFHARDIIQIVK